MHQQCTNLCHMASTVGILIQFIFSSQKCTMGPVPDAAATSRCHLFCKRKKKKAMNNSMDFYPCLFFLLLVSWSCGFMFHPFVHTYTHSTKDDASNLCRQAQLVIAYCSLSLSVTTWAPCRVKTLLRSRLTGAACCAATMRWSNTYYKQNKMTPPLPPPPQGSNSIQDQ